MLDCRVLAPTEDWNEVVELKRTRAYQDVMGTSGWSREQVHEVYLEHWNSKGIDFHDMMLRKAAEGGDLLVWQRGEKIVAYAAVRISRLCLEDGPAICNTGDLLIVPEATDDERRQVAQDLIAYGKERDSVLCEFQIDAPDEEAFRSIGFRSQKVVMRI